MQTAAITDLTHLGLLRISGEGAKKLLQGQMTCDLEEITTTQSRLGAQCNPQGRMISLFRLFLHENQYFLQMPRALIPTALSLLKKYAVFFKVNLEDKTADFSQLGYSGPALQDFPQAVDEATYINQAMIIRIPGETPRFVIIAAPSNVTSLKKELFHHLPIHSPEAWKSQDMKIGLATLYPETSGQFLPHEINLPIFNGISFKKGCYTGQEIIARMEYRGKLKNHLYYAEVKTEKPPERGHDIYRQHERCGNIVDYNQLSYNHYELLVIAPDSDIHHVSLGLDPENTVILEF